MKTLNLKSLKKISTYPLNKTAWFYSKKNNFWELSNMSGGFPIMWKGDRWNSTEQLYQASKYSLHAICIPESAKTKIGAIANVRERIFKSTNPRGAKMTQKCAVKAGLIREDWDNAKEIRIYSMLWVLELKLYNHPSKFGNVLKSTGNLPIVEKSSKDSFWGTKEINGMFVGANILGKLLTILRDENFDAVKKGIFSYTNGFLLEK